MIELNFKRAELEDKELISHYFKHHTSRSCERTFVNVYLWSRHYKVQFAIVEDALVFKSEDEDRLAFAFPAGEPENVKKALKVLRQYSEERGVPFCMYNVTPDNFELLEEWYPQRFRIEYNEDLADYVYESEKLITLSGKKLHGKRNHINKFKSLYEDRWSYETITRENVEECFQMALNWRNQNGCEEDIEKNAETIQAFTDALQKGMDYVQEHSAEEIAKCIAPQFAETGSDTLTAIVARYQEQDTWKKDLIFHEDAFDLLQNILEDSDVLKERVPYEKLVTEKAAAK